MGRFGTTLSLIGTYTLLAAPLLQAGGAGLINQLIGSEFFTSAVIGQIASVAGTSLFPVAGIAIPIIPVALLAFGAFRLFAISRKNKNLHAATVNTAAFGAAAAAFTLNMTVPGVTLGAALPATLATSLTSLGPVGVFLAATPLGMAIGAGLALFAIYTGITAYSAARTTNTKGAFDWILAGLGLLASIASLGLIANHAGLFDSKSDLRMGIDKAPGQAWTALKAILPQQPDASVQSAAAPLIAQPAIAPAVPAPATPAPIASATDPTATTSGGNGGAAIVKHPDGTITATMDATAGGKDVTVVLTAPKDGPFTTAQILDPANTDLNAPANQQNVSVVYVTSSNDISIVTTLPTDNGGTVQVIINYDSQGNVTSSQVNGGLNYGTNYGPATQEQIDAALNKVASLGSVEIKPQATVADGPLAQEMRARALGSPQPA